jgi:hypothetical protein
VAAEPIGVELELDAGHGASIARAAVTGQDGNGAGPVSAQQR